MTKQENNYFWMFKNAVQESVRAYRRENNSKKYLRLLFRTHSRTPGVTGNDIVELIAWKPFVGQAIAIFSRQFHHRPYADFPKGPEDLFLWVCHDDCWVSYGVERFFQYNHQKLESLFLGHFVEEIHLNDELFDDFTRYLRFKRTDKEMLRQQEILANIRRSYQK